MVTQIRIARAVTAASAFLLAVTVYTATAGAATVTIVNLDGPDEGFNDSSAAIPIGGNEGTTLGEQRLIAARFAAEIWGSLLESDVEILIDAEMDPLDCTLTGAVLGSANARSVFRDFAGAPVADTHYPAALANKLAGTDLAPDKSDVRARFNSSIGTDCPFPRSWYYGLDGNVVDAAQIDFVSVVLHELAHGLGFLTFVNVTTGKRMGDRDDAYMLHLEDHATGDTWEQLDDMGRMDSATGGADLHWVGPRVAAGSEILSSGADGDHVRMYAPSPALRGSSVNHFATGLSPDEALEPAYTGVEHDPRLAIAVLGDIGWGAPATCGDGVVDIGEICDDGNREGGDCCAADCSFEAESSPCSDGEPCTDDACDGLGTCVSTNNSIPCDDGNECTVGDVCNAGSCQAGGPRDCDDGRVCTEDSCNPATGCTNDFMPGCTTTTTTTTLPEPAGCGDANEDGRVTSTDALFTLKNAVGDADCDLALCDADGNGRITSTDALVILKHAVGQSVELRCPAA